MITTMIEDVIAATRRRLNALSAGSADAIREADGPIGAFSSSMAEADRDIKVFLSPRLYRHARIVRIMTDAEQVVTDLFRRYARDPADLPAEWAQDGAIGEPWRLRRIADFIAGMTDRYALIEHARLFDSTPELR
jgi:dGTPase